MLSDKARSALEALFQPLPDGQPSLGVLRSDLKKTYPELDPGTIVNRARDDLLSGGDRPVNTEGPVLRIRAVVSEVAAVEPPTSQASGPETPAERTCVSADAETDGWFASHAFRIARVHHEVEQVAVARAPGSNVRIDWLGYAIARIKRAPGGLNGVYDYLELALAHTLDKAWQFDCDKEFGAWFSRILNSTIVNVIRGMETGPERAVGGEGERPGVLLPDPDVEPTSDLGPWASNVTSGFSDHGVDASQDSFLLTAKFQLELMGIKDPPEAAVDRWARFLRRLHDQWVVRKKAPRPADEVPLNEYELHIAYGTHRDLRKEIDAGHAAVGMLDRVQRGIEELIMFQERKKKGRGGWQMPTGGPAGPVEQLELIQTESWGSLVGQSDDGVLWKVARNLHWFSWRLKALATFAAGLRHARRQGAPELQDLIEVLRSLDCLKTFSAEIKIALSRFVAVVDSLPHGPHADAQGPVVVLRTVLRRAGLAATEDRAVATDAELPDADWKWWSSRVTGHGRASADIAIRRLAHSAGLDSDSFDRG